MHSTPEQLFTAFLRHRDAEALAAAFDHTAPELLRVAAFLLPADEVEDAVHDTFVVAMNRGEAGQDQRALQLLAVGKHTVTVTADGWQPQTASVDVHADAVTEVAIWLHRQ